MSDNTRANLFIAALLLVLVGVAVWIDQQPEDTRQVSAGSMR